MMICFRCGICCASFQPRIEKDEAEAIASSLGLRWERFRQEYTDPAWPGVRSFIIRQRNGACIFLERMTDTRFTRCHIHNVRPLSCREWKPGIAKRECCEGLSRYWSLKIGRKGRLEGNSAALEEFGRFLEVVMLEGHRKKESGS